MKIEPLQNIAKLANNLMSKEMVHTYTRTQKDKCSKYACLGFTHVPYVTLNS